MDAFLTDFSNVLNLLNFTGPGLKVYTSSFLLITIAVALFFGLFGYRFFRLTVTAGGLAAGFICGSAVCNFLQSVFHFELPQYAPLIVQIIFAVIAAFLAHKLLRAGIFLAAGAATFFFLNGFSLFDALVDKIYPADADIKYVIARLIIAAIIGFIALQMTRLVIIVTTAVTGGTIVGSALALLFIPAGPTFIRLLLCIVFALLCLASQLGWRKKRRND